jgi:hypothetical protein
LGAAELIQGVVDVILCATCKVTIVSGDARATRVANQ